jgi:chromosomal replication initiator protein
MKTQEITEELENSAPESILEIHTDWLNPSYTFDKFIRSKSNELVLMACHNFILSSGRVNPLFIYGPHGTGKTHLVHAIAKSLINKKPDIRIGYLTVEDFKKEFTASVFSNNNLNFKKKYCNYNTLIIEDIQNLKSTAEQTQEEFFYIFNAYYESGKQILITSACPAPELNITSRLMSRFLSGLHVGLSSPDAELKKKYIAARTEEFHIKLSDDIIDYLTANITGSVRETESALNKLYFLNMRGFEINNIQEVARQLNDLVAVHEYAHPMDMDLIVNEISELYNVSKDELLSSSRKTEYTLPRHIAMYIAITFSGMNKSAVARYFKRSDHSTVINAEKKIKKLLQNDAGLASQIESIRMNIRKRRV